MSGGSAAGAEGRSRGATERVGAPGAGWRRARGLLGCGSPAATPRSSGSARRHRGEELGRFLFLWLPKPCRVGRGHLSSVPGPHVQALGTGACPEETGSPQHQGSSCRQDGWSRQSRSVSWPSWLPGHTLRASLPSRAQASFPWAQQSAQRLWGALGDPARVGRCRLVVAPSSPQAWGRHFPSLPPLVGPGTAAMARLRGHRGRSSPSVAPSWRAVDWFTAPRTERGEPCSARHTHPPTHRGLKGRPPMGDGSPPALRPVS